MKTQIRLTVLLSSLLAVFAYSQIKPAPPPNGAPAKGQRAEALTPAQLGKVKEILAAYKPNSLTADDAKSIKRQLRDAGLRRGPALGDALHAAGFNPKRLDELDPRPPGPPPEGARPQPDGKQSKAGAPEKR